MSYATMQQEHKEWLKVMYPDQPPSVPAAGMLEEAGELLKVHIKITNQHRWGVEPRYDGKDWHRELVDAVGDCCIYVCSLCNAEGWDFAELMSASSPVPASNHTVGQLLSSLVMAAANTVNLRWEVHVRSYVSILKAISACLVIEFDQAVEVTWAKVKQRNRDKTCE
jgi:hypothetical protein